MPLPAIGGRMPQHKGYILSISRYRVALNAKRNPEVKKILAE